MGGMAIRSAYDSDALGRQTTGEIGNEAVGLSRIDVFNHVLPDSRGFTAAFRALLVLMVGRKNGGT